MDEINYHLVLRNPQGASALGTLAYRFTDLEALAPADVKALLGEALQRPTVELAVFKLAGTLTVPWVTGLGPVPVEGIALLSVLGPPLAYLFSSTDPQQPLSLQFNNIDADHIGGGLLTRPGEPLEQVWSILGTKLGL